MNNVVEHDDRTPPAFGPGAPAAGGGPRGASSTRTGKARPVREWVAGWDWRTHPPVWATVNVCLAVLWMSWLGHKIDAPWWIPAAVGVIGAIGAVASGMADDHSLARLGWRAACWLIPAAWACVAVAIGPWHLPLLIAGALAAVVAGVFARVMVKVRKAMIDRLTQEPGSTVAGKAGDVRTCYADEVFNAADPAGTNLDALAMNWRWRIKRVARMAVVIPEIAMWDSGTGYTLRGRLPRGGHGWKDLAIHAEALANDAGLPPTCGITVRADKSRRDGFEMQVVHVDVMGETVAWDGNYSPISIYHRLPLGRLADGLVFAVALKWVCMVLTGQTGSGKSSMLALLNMQIARCVDTVLWHIDVGGGGGISRPWVTPWKEGLAPHPVVDWAAVTEGETETMLRAALAIIKGRKRAYANRMRDARDNKIPCSPEIPHIVIVLDEFGSLPPRIQTLATEISDTGRAAGVRLITCSLRATAEYLPAAIKKQARVRVGMRIDDEEEINYLYGWKEKVDPDLAPYEGSGFVMNQEVDDEGKPVGKKYLSPFKAYFVDEGDIIDTIAPAVAGLRPALDAASAKLANSVGGRKAVYDTRWERTLPLLFADDEEDETGVPVPSAAGGYEPDDGGTADDSHARMRELGEQLKAKFEAAEAEPERPAREQEVDLGDIDAAFEQLVGGLSGTDEVDEARDEAHVRDTVMLELVDAAGANGIIAPDLQKQMQARGFKVEYTKYIHRWLKSYVDERLVVKVEVQIDGRKAGYLYIARPHFQEDQ